ncbi:hypothetical protein B9Z55_000248 [Caenorhabditis nigoni]|uniref:Uncharacterized protein n=1 Tax=Caenorhabditis nigoni TaxID=1611254 RepID=A0A2G5VKU4_9PELO|nr:hypothetical protein B9Z55_000248 [Caenorhabditis nigoni]
MVSTMKAPWLWLPGALGSGTQAPGSQGPKDPRTQGPQDPRTQGPKDPRTQGPKDPGAQGPRDPGTQGPKDPGVPLLWSPEKGELIHLSVSIFFYSILPVINRDI